MSKEYPRPVITADVILWHKDAQLQRHVALILRGKEPFANHYALPGGHFDVDKDPSIQFAAYRELHEELGIKVKENELQFVKYFDNIGRDPRGRYVDFVFCYRVDSLLPLSPGDDAANGFWFPVEKIQEMPLAFDHHSILRQFFAWNN